VDDPAAGIPVRADGWRGIGDNNGLDLAGRVVPGVVGVEFDVFDRIGLQQGGDPEGFEAAMKWGGLVLGIEDGNVDLTVEIRIA
jgi:hypothetical protein